MNGEVAYRGAHGQADRELGHPNTPETRYKLASLHKQLLAGLVLTLVDADLIELEGSICQGVTACPRSLEDVTYHHVLTHTSGIGELQPEEEARIKSNEEALRVIAAADRLSEPGKGWAYSTTAYSLLTATTQIVTGVPLRDLESSRVYAPAGMLDTAFDGLDGPVPDGATGYRADGTPAPHTPGNWSTVDDLWAWHRALRAAKPIPGDLVRRMEQRHVEIAPQLFYGYGVEVRETLGRREVSHRGGTEGFTSYLVRFPDDDAMIALLSNSEATDVDALREQLIAELFAKPT